MGTATTQAPCGCCMTRLMEPEEDVWITWIRCAEHYDPEVDDPKIIEAARNRMQFEAKAP